MNLVRAITVILLLATCVTGRSLFRSWFNPVTALAGPFIIGLCIQIVDLRFLPLGWRAAALIVAGPLFLLFGSAASIANARERHAVANVVVTARQPPSGLMRRSDLLTLITSLSVGSAIAYTYVLYRAIVVNKSAVVNGVFYREVFLAGPGNAFIYRVLLAAMYAGALFVTVDALARGFRRPGPIAFLVLAVIQSVLLSTRTSSFLIFLIFGCGYALSHASDLRRVSARAVAVPLLLVVVMASLFTVIASQRAGSRGGSRPLRSLEYFFAGSPSALSLALDHDVDVQVDHSFGITFGGIREALGHHSRTTGLYQQSTVQLHAGDYKTGTNIYTWYYPLLLDFGLIGSLALLFGLGMLVGPLQLQATSGRITTSKLCLLTSIYLALLWALNVPLSYYNFWFLLLIMGPIMGRLYDSARSDALSAA